MNGLGTNLRGGARALARAASAWRAEIALLLVAALAGLMAVAAHRVEDRALAVAFASVVVAAALTSVALPRLGRRSVGLFVADTTYRGAATTGFVCVRRRGGESYLIAVFATLGLVGVALVVFPEWFASRFFSATLVRTVGLLAAFVSIAGCVLEASRQSVGGSIALVPKGIIWVAFETGTSFVPWHAVASVAVESIGPRRMLGVRVRPPSELRQPPWARPVAAWNRWAYGYELLCPLDSLPIEPETMRAALRRYAANPLARQAIGTPEEFARIR